MNKVYEQRWGGVGMDYVALFMSVVRCRFFTVIFFNGAINEKISIRSKLLMAFLNL